jgi:hypothetical protein
MLAGFAQMDNDVKSERSRNGLRARFLAGIYTGPAPLGYRKEHGYIVKDPEMFETVKKAWDLMETGSKTLREIAKIMNYWGLRQAFKGKQYPLRVQNVGRLFRNKFYMGILVSDRHIEEVKGQHPPMISEQQFYKVQAILDGRNTNITIPIGKRNKEHEDFPLRRIVTCGKCGRIANSTIRSMRASESMRDVCRGVCGLAGIAGAAIGGIIELVGGMLNEN